MTTKEKIESIAEVLKSRFPNLSVKEVVNLSFEILEKLEKQ